jgi:hypothetical protein
VESTSENPFNELIGKELSSIEFVRDYIQFRFDGPCLTAITDPTIQVRGVNNKRSTNGFCDTILKFIGLQVIETIVVENESICIRFLEDCSINISLRPEDYVTTEAATFDNGSRKLWVW